MKKDQKIRKMAMAAVIFVLVFAYSVTNVIVADVYSGIIEANPQEAITFLGTTYGAGMGSMSFVIRCAAAGFVGLILSVMIAGYSLFIWFNIIKDEDD